MRLRDLEPLVESNVPKDKPFITYDDNRYVVHTTGHKAAEQIRQHGFKTGKELNVAEKRSAVYFSDKHVNKDLYSRTDVGDTYDGQKPDYIEVNIKGLRLLNMTYKEDGQFVHHRLYRNYVTRGELDQIPHDIHGTIDYLDNGDIYEVALFKEVANKLLQR